MSDSPKTTRTIIRLKHSLAEDEEIHAVLPDTLDEFEGRIANGELKEVAAKLGILDSDHVAVPEPPNPR